MDEFHTRKIGNTSLSHDALFLAMDFANDDDVVIDTEEVVTKLVEWRRFDKQSLSAAQKELGDVCKRALKRGVEVLVVSH